MILNHANAVLADVIEEDWWAFVARALPERELLLARSGVMRARVAAPMTDCRLDGRFDALYEPVRGPLS